jgi:hypothetical protein
VEKIIKPAESQYWKYFRTEPKKIDNLPEYRGKPSYSRESGLTRVVDLTTAMVGGAPNIGTTWFWPRPGITNESGVKAHTHSFDETLGFFGTNPDDQKDLGGEVEFWLEDEKFIFTTNFIVHVPAGMKHCPVIMRRVERPIFHFGITPPGVEYT